MFSEGSCNTEDWSNDAENSAMITEINYILKCIKIENSYLNSNNIAQFYCVFDQIDRALPWWAWEIYFKNMKKIWPTPKV